MTEARKISVTERLCIDKFRQDVAINPTDQGTIILNLLDTHFPDTRNWVEVLAIAFEGHATAMDHIDASVSGTWRSAARLLREARRISERNA